MLGAAYVPPSRPDHLTLVPPQAVAGSRWTTTDRAAVRDSPTCDSCAGAGWKYVTRRSDLQAVARDAGRSQALERRSCVDCAGSGKSAA